MKKTVEITALTYGGRGLGRIDNKVVFVPFTVPGDICEVEITTDKKNFSEGRLLSVITPSPDRVEAKCPVFTKCGGCHWQHINYKTQLEWKGRIFKETLERAAGIELPPTVEVVASKKEYRYRTSVGLHVKDGSWGFFAPASHDIVDIDDCPLLDERLNETLRKLKTIIFPSFILASLYKVDLTIDLLEEPNAKADDDSVVVAAFYVTEKIKGFDWNDALKDVQLKGFEVRLKKPVKDQIVRGRGKAFIRSGDLTVGYEVDGLKLKASSSTFRQANLLQNTTLVEKVIEFSKLTEESEVLDLFCGIGNLTLPLAKRCKSALGVDADSETIKNAIENAERIGIDNADFLAAEATLKVLRNSDPKGVEKETPRVVILDPPRTGAKNTVVEIAASDTKVERIVYVSCDPSTLARDIKVLKEAGYAVENAVCIDMFAETYHIEAVVGLSLI
ncbi:MAG: 23S rRNA (uracil(1939)-C(5))-methyltransferase RlmD [Deltaproteobacteria bacterium]|nr:23S rRNA (uracil(1939)-C(5))-methyltransferase RlmD [Deltaproteobacteria bacterium]